MSRTVAVIAPMVDEDQYDLDFRILLSNSGRELTLSTLLELAKDNFSTQNIHPIPSKRNMMPAAGFYLAGLLREQGYHTLLTNEFNKESLELIASENPFAVCLSSTMILSNDSLRNYLNKIREYLPEAVIIVGGIYVWKSYQFYEWAAGKKEFENSSSELLFHANSSDFDADVFVVAPHGREALLMVLKELRNGKNSSFENIPNLALPDSSGKYFFTRRKDEEVDYNQDFTRWDFIDELPEQIPIRTSIGCPFRCRYCDFYRLNPTIFLRSKESLKKELGMLVPRIKNTASIIHATDDNIFIHSNRLKEVAEVFINAEIKRWIGFMRASAINESNIDLLRRSGLLIALVGVESGDEGQLRRMNKAQSLEKVKRGIELMDQCGINVLMTYIMGFPGETPETVNNTALFIDNLQVGRASSSYLLFPLFITPFSDLALTDYRRKWQIKGLRDHWSHYTMNHEESIEYSAKLFRQVSRVPYHYTQERTFFNQQAFTEKQRLRLFELRQKLTIALMDKLPENHIREIIIDISGELQLPVESISDEFINEITIG
jgi:p-methyltransferase